MTLVGLAFAFVALVAVLLTYRYFTREVDAAGVARVLRLEQDLAELRGRKPPDHTADLAALAKRVGTLETSTGLKNIR